MQAACVRGVLSVIGVPQHPIMLFRATIKGLQILDTEFFFLQLASCLGAARLSQLSLDPVPDSHLNKSVSGSKMSAFKVLNHSLHISISILCKEAFPHHLGKNCSFQEQGTSPVTWGHLLRTYYLESDQTVVSPSRVCHTEVDVGLL